MNIESAAYVRDGSGQDVAIQITYIDDAGKTQVCTVPVAGTTWINMKLSDWIAAGNAISAAAIQLA